MVTPDPPHLFFDAVNTLFRLSRPVGETYANIASNHHWIVEPSALHSVFTDLWQFDGSTPPDYPACPSGEHAEYLWWQSFTVRVFDEAAKNPSTQVGEPVTNWFDEVYAHYAHPSAWHLFCDAIPALHRLEEAGIPIHILSNFDHRLASILQGFGIIEKFTTITTSSLAKARKPNRQIFEFARTSAGSPADCTHIGDDPINDFSGARGAGFNAILVDRKSGIDLMTITDQLLAQTR